MRNIYTRKNLVFTEDFSLEDLKQIAQKEDWVETKEVLASSGEPYQIHWQHKPLDLYLLYVVDERIGVNYLEVRAVIMSDALEYLQNILPLENKEDILKFAQSENETEKIQAIKKLGYVFAFEDFNPECFKVLVKAMQESKKEIFVTTLETVPYLKWRQFESILEELTKSDLSVKTFAGHMLKAMRDHEWNA
ncbi:MAG: hypothetical protein JNN11_00110 [Candidatus Doudnabacteria bacterium]|nr:hypothetical protein [Candidatus Doudnabacteria bacterium]